MNKNVLTFFNVQRQIFGICPRSGNFFRLSHCRILRETGDPRDWLSRLELDQRKIENAEDRLSAREDRLREIARVKGRSEAAKLVRKVDPIFAPRKLDAADAKVLLNPVDFMVFNGMSNGYPKSVSLLDRKNNPDRKIQRSIESCVERGNVEWLTIRVSDDGHVKVES